MTQRVASYNPRDINRYVASMSYAMDVVHGRPHIADLGTPAVADADLILAAASATDSAQTYGQSDFATTYDYGNGLDATYGRNLTATGTAGSNHVVTVKGRDYLGQPMQESLTLSGTSVITGNKAFKWITEVAVAVGAAGDTFNLGTGSKLGLPYKAKRLITAYEQATATAQILETPFDAPTREVHGGACTVSGANAATAAAPFDGYWTGWRAEVTTAVTVAQAVMDATKGGAAAAAADGIIPIAAAGFVAGALIAPASWIAVNRGDSCVLTSDAGPTAGVADFVFLFSRGKPADGEIADETTATLTTNDTRGLLVPVTTLDGTIRYFCEYEPDRSNLHGVAQYWA